MKIDSNAPAFPSQNGVQYDPGLTIRAEIASRVMAGLVCNGNLMQPRVATARESILYADALIAELNREEKP